MVFPFVRGENLEGRAFTLPADLERAYNLLFIAFQRDQQADIDSWLPFVKQLVKEYPALAYYELPTIYRGNPLFRWWLNTSMSVGIPGKKAREVTITLYLDKQGDTNETHPTGIYGWELTRYGQGQRQVDLRVHETDDREVGKNDGWFSYTHDTGHRGDWLCRRKVDPASAGARLPGALPGTGCGTY